MKHGGASGLGGHADERRVAGGRKEPDERTRLSEAEFRFLGQQVLLFQGFALHLAEELGLAPEEAGRCFWQDQAGTRNSRSVDVAELARVAQLVAEDTSLIYGHARLEQVGEGWRVETTVSDQDRRRLETWGVSLVRRKAAHAHGDGSGLLQD